MQIGLALLTSNCQTYDHGIKLCIDTQFCHLIFREKLKFIFLVDEETS
jgi:hypothetical protein